MYTTHQQNIKAMLQESGASSFTPADYRTFLNKESLKVCPWPSLADSLSDVQIARVLVYIGAAWELTSGNFAPIYDKVDDVTDN